MRRNLIIILVLGLGVLAGNAFAEDYSRYSTEELANMRGTLQDASQEERDAFRAEWQKRLQQAVAQIELGIGPLLLSQPIPVLPEKK